MSSLRQRRGLVLLGLAAVAAFGAACEALIPIHEHAFEVTGDAGSDASDAGGPPAVCPVAFHPPPKPAVEDPGPSVEPYLLALSAFDLAVPSSFGYDLDNACSCDSRDNSVHADASVCTPPSSMSAISQCDQDGGVDNALASQASRLPPSFHLSDRLNQQIACGVGTMMIGLFDYNGLANDQSVYIILATSRGIYEPHPSGGDPDAAATDGGAFQVFVDGGDGGESCGYWSTGKPYPARFDGTDLWSTPPEGSYKGTPVGTAFFGYVADHRLVVQLAGGDAGVAVPLTGTATLHTQSSILTARLVPLNADLTESPLPSTSPAKLLRFDDGVMGGRTNRVDVLNAFGLIPTNSTGELLCTSPFWAPVVQQGVCSAADLTDQPSTDFQGAPCTALSAGIGFTAFPAKIGSVTDAGGGQVDASACPPSSFTCP